MLEVTRFRDSAPGLPGIRHTATYARHLVNGRQVLGIASGPMLPLNIGRISQARPLRFHVNNYGSAFIECNLDQTNYQIDVPCSRQAVYPAQLGSRFCEKFSRVVKPACLVTKMGLRGGRATRRASLCYPSSLSSGLSDFNDYGHYKRLDCQRSSSNVDFYHVLLAARFAYQYAAGGGDIGEAVEHYNHNIESVRPTSCI